MRLPFCDHHICVILETYSKDQKPLDLLLNQYFRSHKSLGAQDRRLIGHTLYEMVRWKSMIDQYCLSSHPLDRLNTFRKISIDSCQQDLSLPEPVRYGVTEFLWDRFCKLFGKIQAKTICSILNQEAPTTIRINPLKTSREELFERWKGKFSITPCSHSSLGIQFQKMEPLFSLAEFKEGLFELQDEGSQLVAALVEAKPKEHVLDYCSGSGGKTLAFAPLMKGQGQIYLHDIRQAALIEARKRLKRAGVQNVQFNLPKQKVDWILADVPCSGTGTLRRNPDAKWKIDASMITRLIETQRNIVKEALAYLKPEGRLVYATCSLLNEENQEQIDYFLKTHSLKLEKEPLFLLPQERGMDGFFAAVMKKQTLL